MLLRTLACWSTLAASLLAASCVAVPVRDPSALEHFETRLRTDDGWELSLFRVPPSAAASAEPHFGTPVLLAHGTAINRYNFMLTGSDMAGFLAERGFDVWIPEFRGDRSSRAPQARIWRRGEWTLEDMAARDIPVVLDHIKAASGHDRVWWIGHSLGGILGYVVLQGPRAADVAGLVAIGSPGSYEHPNRFAIRSHRARHLLPKHGQLPARALARMGRALVGLAPDSEILHAIFNYENVELSSMVGFVESGMENIGISLLRQYDSWLEHGHLLSADGTVDYSVGLQRIQAPVLLLAGRVDHIVPPWAVRAAYDRLGSADKSFVVLGTGWGTRYDYGHGDLLVGSRVVAEVFPLISGWMETRIAGRDAPTGALELQVEAPRDPLLEASDLEDEEPLPDARGAADDPAQAPSEGR
jgi:pimeloyl-ACP methyl ester carboxylesterase